MTPSRICKTRDMQHQRGGSRAAKEQGVQRCAQPVAQLLRRLPGAPWPGAFLCLGLEATRLEESWPAAVLTRLGATEVGLKQGRGRLGWSSASRRSAPVSIRTAGSRLELRLAPPGALDPTVRGARAGELLRIGEVLVRGRGARAGASRGARLVLPPVVELAWRRGPKGAPPRAAWAPVSTRALARRCPEEAEVRATALDLVGRRSAGSTRRIPPGRRSACCRLVPAGGGRGRSRRLEELRDGVEEGGDGGRRGGAVTVGPASVGMGKAPVPPRMHHGDPSAANCTTCCGSCWSRYSVPPICSL
jgi:hypothetical protein